MDQLIAASSSPLAWAPWAASGLVGAAILLASWWLFASLATEDAEQEDDWRFDVSRINELRRIDSLFRMFQPVIRFFARINRAALRDALPGIQKDIGAAGVSRFWLSWAIWL